ncbi:MAG: hypothetical protein HYY79_12175 [Betaproteobacteria bacterium]|nr:hypothetical protein [Betaproteobacteria bacterium]
MGGFRSGWPEEGIAIALTGIAVAVGLPAVYKMVNLSGQEFELALAIAGAFGALGTWFGGRIALETVSSPWRFSAWALVGAAFSVFLAIGAASSRIEGWQAAFALLALLTIAAICWPLISFWRARRGGK